VTLDGSGSSDPNGGGLLYQWVQTDGPPVSFSPDVMITTFAAPAANDRLAFALTVTDPGGLSDSDSVRVTVGPFPTADAGADQETSPKTTVTLDGSGSSDPDGNPLTYQWVQVGGVEVDFSPTLSVTTFIAPSGVVTFTLVVTNNAGLSDDDATVVVAVERRIYLPYVLTGGTVARGPVEQSATTTVVARSTLSAGCPETVTARPWCSIWPAGWVCEPLLPWDVASQRSLACSDGRGGSELQASSDRAPPAAEAATA
jgi:hypothetical protein